MVRLALRTGLRWKLSAAIALVGALVAIALSLVVHNAARHSMLDNSRDVQIERLTFTQKIFVSTNRLQFGAKIDDPALPEALRDEVAKNKRATYLQDTGQTAPDVWAASPLSNGRVLSVHDRFPDRFAVLDDLDQALVIGSTAVVVGGCALGVLVGGRLSKRLRKAAAAAGKLADGDTAVRIRDEVGSGRVRDETDDLAFAVDAMSDALQERIEAERRVTADIAHELRTPVTGLLTAAELLPPGRPRSSYATVRRRCAPSSRTCWKWPGSTAMRSAPSFRTSRSASSSPGGCAPSTRASPSMSYGTPRSPRTRAGWSGSSAI